MPPSSDDVLGKLVAKLGRLGTLNNAERSAIMALPYELAAVETGRYLVEEGRMATSCCLLVCGYACRHKLSGNGGRQILSFHMAGDLLDLQHLQLPQADHNVQMITAGTVAWIPFAPLRAICHAYPAVNDALWRDALIDASIFREWVLNVGRRDAKQRIAHMLCEFASRREALGLGSPERLDLPMTQEDIGDATGLTPVHVNRMLKLLAAEGVIDRPTPRQIRIADWAHMQRIADFHPAYLHQAA